MRRPRTFGAKRPTRKCAVSAVASLVNGCRPERLEQMTAESLVASYGVTLAKADELLDAARRARG